MFKLGDFVVVHNPHSNIFSRRGSVGRVIDTDTADNGVSVKVFYSPNSGKDAFYFYNTEVRSATDAEVLAAKLKG